MTESSKTSGMMIIGAKGDDDRCGANVDYIVMHDRENRDLVEHDGLNSFGGRLVERATRVPAQTLAAGSRGQQSEQTSWTHKSAAEAQDEAWPDVHYLLTSRRTSARKPCSGLWEGRDRSSGEEGSKTQRS